MDSRRRLMRLKQLDQALDQLDGLRNVPAPSGGWIRAIRESLGMGLDSFAQRVGVGSPSAVLKLEQNEVHGVITMKRLKDAADALGCDLAIAFLPREPLLQKSQQQALTRAQDRLKRVGHTMEMEAQTVAKSEMDEMIRQAAEQILQKGGKELWG